MAKKFLKVIASGHTHLCMTTPVAGNDSSSARAKKSSMKSRSSSPTFSTLWTGSLVSCIAVEEVQKCAWLHNSQISTTLLLQA